MIAPNTATDGQPSRLRDLLVRATRQLGECGIDSAALDAALLLQYATGMAREQLITDSQRTLDKASIDRFQALVERRSRREPVAYLTGHQEFWSLDFFVTSAVLIPRPETERLIEITLARIVERGPGSVVRIFDLGTGSGAIAVSLAKEIPSAAIIACDISPHALQVAQRNATEHSVLTRIQFIHGDLFAALGADTVRFDFILANPPYIRRDTLAQLPPDVYRWEPLAALDGGADGLIFYRRMAAEAVPLLSPDGEMIVEIGADQGTAVVDLFVDAGFSDTELYQDYAGRNRVVRAGRRFSRRG